MNVHYLLTTLISVTVFGIAAAGQNEKKITPVLEIGAGLSAEAASGYGERGLATDVSFGLEIYQNEKWSVMPQIGFNTMFDWDYFRGYVGGDYDTFGFLNASVLGRYRIDDGMAVGFGPAIYHTAWKTNYYIDADPFDPRNELAKIKPWDFGLRASLSQDYGKHWRVGVLANIGLRNMKCQYPEVGITGHTHLFSLNLFAGYRF